MCFATVLWLFILAFIGRVYRCRYRIGYRIEYALEVNIYIQYSNNSK